ncbi:MAG: MlaD family protein, partial [Myxococcota bacterium]|nr:MlaD family protein [Myxococcota bacterium]
MDTRSLERRIGAIALVAGAVIIAGGLWLARPTGPPPVTYFVDFPAAAGLKGGAKVCVAGVPSGIVDSVTSHDGRHDEALGRRVFVRVAISMAAGPAGLLRQDAHYAITTEGVLGERYVEITPGEGAAPPIRQGTIVEGVPSFEYEKLVRHGNTLNRVVGRLAREHGPGLSAAGEDITETVSAATSVVDRVSTLVDEHSPEVDALLRRWPETRQGATRTADQLAGALATAQARQPLRQMRRTDAMLRAGTKRVTEEGQQTLARWLELRDKAGELGEHLAPKVEGMTDASTVIA